MLGGYAAPSGLDVCEGAWVPEADASGYEYDKPSAFGEVRGRF
jgi:hypothetical protein